MQVPPEWKTTFRKRKSPNATGTQQQRKKSKNSDSSSVSQGSLEQLSIDICKEILDSKESKNKHELENFDSILSTVPYQQILQSIFSDEKFAARNIPVITRSYEESFMREPLNRNERPCAMGQHCECMRIDPQNQFVGVEFKLPVEETIGPHLCVLCSRKMTQKLFYDLMYGDIYNGYIQRYGVIVNSNGEYKSEYCLIMPPQGHVQCMPYPSVAHCRNNYTVQIRSCIRYLVQKTDMVFQMPLS